MKSSNTRLAAAAVAAILALAAAPAALAATGVAGTLSTGVTGSETLLVSGAQINFLPPTDPNITTNTTSLTDNGAPVIASTGFVQSLAVPTGFPIDKFLTLDGTPIDYELNGIGTLTDSGVGTPASTNGTNCASLGIGQSCVIASSNSPYLLISLGPTTTELVVLLNGWATDTAPVISGGKVTNGNPFFGSFSTNVLQSAGAIQASVLGGGSISCSGAIGCSDSGILTLVVAPLTTITGDCPFQIRYAANLNIGDSVVNIVNTGANGAPLNGPGLGTPTGNMCVNVYTFSPDEQLISCCSCNVTPNALVALSVVNDLISNTLTGVKPDSVVIKLLGTLNGPGGSGSDCTNSAALVTATSLATGVAAWGTTLHLNTATAAWRTTETPFTCATLSPGELDSITNRCSNIAGNGSGFGICRSCRAGGLGASKF